MNSDPIIAICDDSEMKELMETTRSLGRMGKVLDIVLVDRELHNRGKLLKLAVKRMRQSIFTLETKDRIAEVRGRVADCVKHLKKIYPEAIDNLNIESPVFYDHLPVEETFNPKTERQIVSQTHRKAHKHLRLSANGGRQFDRKFR